MIMKVGALSACLGLLVGCAAQGYDASRLDSARLRFESVQANPMIMTAAPKDVKRAGESLLRAQQLSGYWGSEDDVDHFSYLSLRYSELAETQGVLAESMAQEAKLGLDLQRLQLRLREAHVTEAEQGGLNEDEIASLLATETDRGLVMTLGDVLFDTGQTELKAGSSRTLSRLARFLELNPQRRIRIEGYTDNVGKAQDNQRLSEARADAIAAMLGEMNVAPSRMEVAGYGEQYPVAENASSSGRAQNRRVEIVFSNSQGILTPPR